MKNKKIKVLIATFLFSVIPGSTIIYGLFFIKKEVKDLYRKYQEENSNPLSFKLWLKKELRILMLEKKIECKLFSKKIKNTIQQKI